jgi:single-stranded-DNA-specific exonuclease
MVEEQMIQTLDIDLEVKFNEIDQNLLNDLKKMQPHGQENQKPIFCTVDVRDSGSSRLVGKDLEHIKLDLIDDSTDAVMSAIAFGMHRFGDHIISGKPFDICYTIEENTYNNVTSIQLLIKDIRINKE